MISLEKNSHIPLYQQLARLIRSQILRGELKPGDKLPGELDLVEQYKLSRSSVRHAIDLLSKEGLVTRIHGKGNFIYNWGEAHSPGGIIALLVPDTRLFLFVDILTGVETTAKSRNYSLVFSYLGEDQAEELRTFQRLRDQNIAGFIIFPRNNETYDDAIWKLFQDGFPFVLIDRYFPDLPSAFVGIDNITAAYSAVDHLIHLGYREIGFASISDLLTTTIRDRYTGYRRALEDHDILYQETWLLHTPSAFPSPIYTEPQKSIEIENYRRLFREKLFPRAVFAINDITAYLVYQAARVEGVRIPQDLALVGFDNDEYSLRTVPPLTTVKQPFREIGERAAHLLIDGLRPGGPGLGLERILLPTELVIRQSCGKQLEATGV